MLTGPWSREPAEVREPWNVYQKARGVGSGGISRNSGQWCIFPGAYRVSTSLEQTGRGSGIGISPKGEDGGNLVGPAGSARILVCTRACWAVTPACHLSPGGRRKGERESMEREGRQRVHGKETPTELEVRLGIHPDLDPRGTRDFPKVFVVLF